MRGLSVVVMLLATSFGCTRPDNHIAAEVQVRLATDPVTRAYAFDVAVVDGVVTLRGETAHREDHRRVQEILGSISDVRDVLADLRISDEILQQRVLELLKTDPVLKQSPIDVTAFRGRIRLSSSDTTADVRARAVALARSIYGVIGVDDHMR